MDDPCAGVPGWFNHAGLFREMVAACPDGGTLVEMGCFMGCGTAFLATEAARAGRGLRVVVVDSFTDGWWKDFYMSPFRGMYELVAADSAEAARAFADGSLSSVFIDGSHEEADVLADLAAWWPKFDGSGFFAGHDYSFPWPDGVRPAVDAFFGGLGLPVEVRDAGPSEGVPMDHPHVMRLARSWVVRRPHG